MIFTQFGRLVLTFWSKLLPQRIVTLRMTECFSEMLEPTNRITQRYISKALFDILVVLMKKSVECPQLHARGMTVLHNIAKDESTHLRTCYG